MNDEENISDNTNLISVINRIEGNQSDDYKQITCRRQEWNILERTLPKVLTEAKLVQESINPFLPRRHNDESEVE